MTDLCDLLELETVEKNLYRANATFDEEYDLYGGQVAAQALLAAGLTVEDARRPHSLHGYFLRPGDPDRPTVFTVHRDRDGRSFSARRVVAIQNGEVIFTMATSFHAVRESAEQDSGEQDSGEQGEQDVPMPEVAAPEDCRTGELPRLFSMSSRFPEQPLAGRTRWPSRFWSRVTVPLDPSPLVHACALTYLSDISTGIAPARDGSASPGPSLDHAVWFHDRVDMNDWVLSDYVPRVSGRGRGWYTGSMFTADGRLVASIAQEALFR